MKSNNRLKSLLILILSSLFLFGFAQLGSSGYETLFKKVTYSKETKIASLIVEGMTNEQALELLVREISKWQEETTIILHMDHGASLDVSYFSFQPEKTIQQVNDSVSTKVDSSLDQAKLKSFLQREFNSNRMNAVNLEQLSNDIQSIAENLEIGIFEFDLNDYLQIEQLEKKIISKATISLDDSKLDLNQNTISIEPSTTFSLQDYLTEKKVQDVDDETASRLATVLYRAVLTSPFEVLERHISRELPDYTELGFEAVFINNKWDFEFYNPLDQPLELSIVKKNDQLVVLIVGVQLEEYKLVIDNEKTYPTRTIVHYDPSLSPVTVHLGKEGKAGQSISVIKQVYLNGKLQNETVMPEDYYPPVYKITKQGLKSNLTETFPEQSQDNSAVETEQVDPSINPSKSDDTQGNNETIDSSNEKGTDNKEVNQGDELWEIPKDIK